MAFFRNKTEKKDEKKPAASFSFAPIGKISEDLLGILAQPRVSEKAGGLAKQNKYVFVVRKSANKILVKKAVEASYKVRVVNVNIINSLGKSKNFGRVFGRTSDFKKAIVTLKQGDSIQGLTETV